MLRARREPSPSRALDVAAPPSRRVPKQDRSGVEAVTSNARELFSGPEGSPLSSCAGLPAFVKRGSSVQSGWAAQNEQEHVSACTSYDPPALQKSDEVRDHKAYLRDYCRAWTARRRAAFFAGKSCVDCGSTAKLELDHVDQSRKVDHRIWSWSEPRRRSEIAKCQVRCGVCHKKRHAEEQRKPLVHGTSNGYRKKGCRCEACSEWNRQRVNRGRRERLAAAGRAS